jgi:hypothetical protein
VTGKTIQEYKQPGVPIKAKTPGHNQYGIPNHQCVGGKYWRPLGFSIAEWSDCIPEAEDNTI